MVAGEVVFHGEELLTTATSALQVRAGVLSGNPHLNEIVYAPFLVTIVDRSDPQDPVVNVSESRLLSLARFEIRNFDPGPETCPFCAAGSEAILPKVGNNWARLKGVVPGAADRDSPPVGSDLGWSHGGRSLTDKAEHERLARVEGL